jgi:hypothetical protein
MQLICNKDQTQRILYACIYWSENNITRPLKKIKETNILQNFHNILLLPHLLCVFEYIFLQIAFIYQLLCIFFVSPIYLFIFLGILLPLPFTPLPPRWYRGGGEGEGGFYSMESCVQLHIVVCLTLLQRLSSRKDELGLAAALSLVDG